MVLPLSAASYIRSALRPSFLTFRRMLASVSSTALHALLVKPAAIAAVIAAPTGSNITRLTVCEIVSAGLSRLSPRFSRIGGLMSLSFPTGQRAFPHRHAQYREHPAALCLGTYLAVPAPLRIGAPGLPECKGSLNLTKLHNPAVGAGFEPAIGGVTIRWLANLPTPQNTTQPPDRSLRQSSDHG